MQIFYSFPHFLNADNKFISSINGLKPDVNKHDSIISLERVFLNTYL